MKCINYQTLFFHHPYPTKSNLKETPFESLACSHIQAASSTANKCNLIYFICLVSPPFSTQNLFRPIVFANPNTYIPQSPLPVAHMIRRQLLGGSGFGWPLILINYRTQFECECRTWVTTHTHSSLPTSSVVLGVKSYSRRPYIWVGSNTEKERIV